MNNRFLFLVGAVIVFFSLFGASITEGVDSVDIGLTNPSDELIDKFEGISSIVTDSQDRVKLAIFNKVFADRLSSYDTNQQQLNDVYVLAAKNYFKDSMKDKYQDLDNFLIKTIRDITGDQVHILSDDEKSDLNSAFTSIAWCLIN